MDLIRLERLADPVSAPRLWDEERQADASALRDALRWMREAHRQLKTSGFLGPPDQDERARLIREYEEESK